VPSALAEARQVLRLAREGGRPPGGYRLGDVLLDHLVSQPEAAAPLRGLLQPLEEGNDLLPTLEAWFAADFERRATAANLVIHPNTLDYRLRRISELTGLDLRTAEAIQLLGAALLARRQAGEDDR
jgi:sugar diacid utilization regulator